MIDKIKAEMELRRVTDPQLDSGMKNPSKTDAELKSYIISCARKEIAGSSGAIESDVVYGWAVHFYTDHVVDEKPKPVEKPKPAEKPKVKVVENKKQIEQLSLFDELF